MPPLSRATRTAAVILALAAADLGIVLPATADIIPTAQSASAPTPCPTDVTGVICQAAGGPTPTPTPTPKPSPTPSRSSAPSSSASPTQSQRTQAGAAAGGTHPGAPPPPPAGRSTPSAIAEAAATFHNAPFLSELLDILRHPTAAQRPDLRHFRPAADQRGAGGGGVLGLPFGGPGGGSLGGAIAAGLLGMLLAMGVGLLSASHQARLAVRRGAARAWSWHPSLHRVFVGLHNLSLQLGPLRHQLRVRLGLPRMAVRRHGHRGLAAASAVAALPALVIAAVLGGAARTSGGALPVGAVAGAPLSGYLRGEVIKDNDVAPAAAQGPAAWFRLVTIERGLAAQQDELAKQEAQIARLVVNLGGRSPDGEDAVVVGPDSATQDRDRLAELVAAHGATQAAFQASLQAEYELYRAAAQDPAQRTQLTQAASAAPQARAAVAYNLSLIQTQLSQEAAIAQAEGRLQALGSLTAEQLRAMRQHQSFITPVVAPVTQPFGPTDFALEPPLAFNGVFSPHFHTGIDLGAPLDTPVHAAADGVVLLAGASLDGSGRLVGYGNYVVVAHPDGFVTLYGHLDSVAVKAGQVVHQGEIVGLEGSTGWSTGPHVHFEIRHDGQFLDPAPYLAGQLPQ